MLTPTQFKLIDKHLRHDNWLINNDLIAELMDYYVDAISAKLAEGMPFELALQDVYYSFGGRNGLLTMEENYLKTRPNARFHLYRSAFVNAFRAPGIGYTLLIFASCSVLAQLLQMEWLSQQIDAVRLAGRGWLLTGSLVGLFWAARIQIQFKLQKGTLRLNPASPPPVYSLLQSAALVTFFLVLPPVYEFARSNAGASASVMTLIFVHNWAWIRMIKISCPKHPTSVA